MSSAGSIAVAGGGIIGLATAWRLAQRGARVAVFDQGRMGGEASWAGAGMLAPGGEMDEPSDLAALALEARRMYPAFVEELREASGLGVDFQEAGALDLAYSEAEWAALEARAARQAPMGIASERVAAEQVRALGPRVRTEGLVGARFYPGDGLVNPREACLALGAACGHLGVRMLANTAVLGVEERRDGVAVKTAEGVEFFDAAAIAAGAWSGSIAVSPGPIPASSPVKGHLLGYQEPARTCPTIVRRGHAYLMQRANGLLIAGASVEDVGFDRRIDAGIAGQLKEAAEFVMPHLRETAPAETWVGFRPGSDALHVGRWGASHIFLAYGHYRNGILLAPVTAQRLAQEISASSGKR